MIPQVELPQRAQPSHSRLHTDVPQGTRGNPLISAPLPGGMRIQDFEETPDPQRVVMPFKVAFQEPSSPTPPGIVANDPITPVDRQETPNQLWDRIGQKQEEKQEEETSSSPTSYWSQYNSKPTVSDTLVSETYVAPASNNAAAQYLSVQAFSRSHNEMVEADRGLRAKLRSMG